MSGDHMKVDYNRLGELQKNLDTAVRVVGHEFENMLALAAAVGDPRLAARSNEFRNSWDKRRLDIVNNLEYLRGSVQSIHDQLSKTDATLASGLTTPAPIAGPGTSAQAV